MVQLSPGMTPPEKRRVWNYSGCVVMVGVVKLSNKPRGGISLCGVMWRWCVKRKKFIVIKGKKNDVQLV